MKIFGLIVKSIATALLLISLVFLSAVMMPIYLALLFKGKAKTTAIVGMIPLGIVAIAFRFIWRNDSRSDTERAYEEGVVAGQVKAARAQGVLEGVKMIAYEEDLRIRPVYSTRAIKAKAKEIPVSSQNAVPVGELFPNA